MKKVNYIENETWYSSDWINGNKNETATGRNAKQALHKYPEDVLNVYTTKNLAGFTGYSTLPISYSGDEEDYRHGIVIDYRTVPGGIEYDNADQGKTAVHEAGHFLGLYHTFYPKKECDQNEGDKVDDTNAQYTSFSDGTSCGSSDPVNNYMSYSSDEMKTEFTSGQSTRMDNQVAMYKPSLGEEVYQTSQTISQNEVFNKYDDVVKLQDNVDITFGGSVNIEPSVHFKMGNGAGITFNGHVQANGSGGLSKNIYFESLDSGDKWDSITADGANSTFRYAVFDEGESGLQVHADGITVNHSLFTGNDFGVDLNQNQDNTTIKNSRFSENTVGLWNSSNGTGTIIKNNNINQSGQEGLHFTGAEAQTINGNYIHNNGAEGLLLLNGSSLGELKDNDIIDNIGAGLYMDGGSSVAAAKAQDNVIKNNQANGVYLSGGSTLYIDDQTHNIIRGNVGPEVYVTGLNTYFHAAVVGGHAYGKNDIYDSAGSDYLIYNNAHDGSYNIIKVQAAGNYWGENLYPPSDFRNPSKVDYNPYCKQSAVSGPCNLDTYPPSGPTLAAKRTVQTSKVEAASSEGGEAYPRDWIQPRMVEVRSQLREQLREPDAARLVRALYGLMLRDQANRLGEEQANWTAITARRSALEQLAPQPPARTTLPTASSERAVWMAGEVALIAEIDDLVRRDQYAQALSKAAEYREYIVSRDAQVTFAQLRARALRHQGQYRDALSAIAEAEAVEPMPEMREDFRAPNYEPIKRDLRWAMNGRGSAPEVSASEGIAAKKDQAMMEVSQPGPVQLALEAAYPNPVRSRATLPLKLPEAAQVHAEVYDVMGRRVATLADGALSAGTHRLTLKAGDLPGGVYVVRARVTTSSGEARVFTRKVTLVR